MLSAVGLGVQLILLFNTGTFMFGNSFGLLALSIVNLVCSNSVPHFHAVKAAGEHSVLSRPGP